MRATTNIMQDEQLRLARIGFSIADQAIVAATRTYITGSAIPITKAGLRVGHVFRWTICIVKTAAGVATSTYDICVGTAGTTADTARVSFTKPIGTAAVDTAWITITATITSIGATGDMRGTFVLEHCLASTGHIRTPGIVLHTQSEAFDMTTEDLILGVCITSGAADAITIQQVIAEMR